MAEQVGFSPAQIFPANRYKALDYLFETTTRLEVIMNLLTLPTPPFPGPTELYVHSGNLTDGTYRTPWTRGKVISTCRLVVSGSILEDLKGKQVYTLERFDATEREMNVDKIQKSDSDSLSIWNQDDYCWPLGKSQISPCQESFTKCTSEEMKPQRKIKDCLLPEDLVAVDYLPQFKRHLPTLKGKLSRLKTLPVTDPLLSSTGATISADTMFRHCASYETPHGVDSEVVHTCANIQEDFGKEPLIRGESLLLLPVVDTMNLKQEHPTTVSRICSLVNVVPEVQEELPSLLDVLHTDVSESLGISRYGIPEELSKKNGSPQNPEFAGRVTLPTEMELDVTLTPQTSQTRICLSASELQKEELSPLHRRPLVSARVRTKMEEALWMAEKHLVNVASFLLAANLIVKLNDIIEKPLSEALRILKLEKQSPMCDGEDLPSQMGTGSPQVFLCNNSGFTESMSSEVPPKRHQETEDFKSLSPEHVQERPIQMHPVNNTAHLKNNKALAFRPEVKTDERLHPREAVADAKQNSLQQTCTVNKKGVMPETFTPIQPAASTKDAVSVVASAGETWRESCMKVQCELVPEQATSSCVNINENHGGSSLVRKCPPEKEVDPLSAFLMLRAQQTDPVSAACQSSASPPAPPADQRTRELQPSPELMETLNWVPTYISGAASRNVSGEQKAPFQSPGQLISQPVSGDSREVQVQATESQRRAYFELLTFAQCCLGSARHLGLNVPVGGDFRCLDPDQTHFLLKQQEKALCRAEAQNTEVVRELETLFNQVALIHVLVTVKELLLKCSLRTAMEYLTQTAETSTEQILHQLLKRLQIILHLSQRKPESDLKLLELEKLLSVWLHGRKELDTLDRVLVLLTGDCENSRSVMITRLKHVTGAAVTAVSPEEGKKKLNGAAVVSSIQDSLRVIVDEQHVGPDFPWNCFSLVVEYERPGHSPWATICRERSISHLCFNTVISDIEREEDGWCLEDNVPYVLFVTEGLLHSSLLLQTLETGFNITVLERSHCPSLQMLGGTYFYAVITVDEKTAIIIQKEDELCQERASEGLVMRLSALSLQYSCCWLILYCPDSQGGGLSGVAFSNLVLVYSSLVLFGMKSEDLNVKVLIVSEVTDIAKWITQICFHSLMNSDRDPLDFLDRGWLTVIPSEEEKCLSQFPCLNPLVSQLMLRRAPFFQWLLGASLSQLMELLPEVPQKVLKHFSDITSLYTSTKDRQEFQTPSTITIQQANPLNSLWSATAASEYNDHQPQPEPHISPLQDLFCHDNNANLLFPPSAAPFDPSYMVQDRIPNSILDMGSSLREPDVHLQRSWINDGGWEHVKFPDWGGRAGVVGGVVQRVNDERRQGAQAEFQSPFKPDSVFRCSPVPERHRSTCSPVWCPDRQRISYCLSPPAAVTPWGHSNTHTSHSRGMTVSASYGSKYWIGQERKRRRDAATVAEQRKGTVLTPLKKSRLSYERVPGRSDGQTRLKLF